MAVAEKLYPPIIGASVPAFYNNNGTALIAVPFSMNRAVSAGDVYSFSLKVKTAQSNSFIKSLESIADDTQSFIGDRVVKFYWENVANDTDFNKIKVGQYLKIQIAYNSAVRNSNGNVIGITPGYFSTVAVVKYTSQPNIFIENAGLIHSGTGIPLFKGSYTGVYQLTEDKNERPYSYNFQLYNNKHKLIEESGWTLHNTSVTTTASEALQLHETTDTYEFTSNLDSNQEYYLRYGVRTINNLEIYSPTYTCIQNSELVRDLYVNLIATNIFEEGYILLSFERDTEVTDITSPISIELERAEIGYQNIDSSNLQWHTIKKYYFGANTSYDWIEDLSFKDYTVEQGVCYIYSFKQYNEDGLTTARTLSNVVESDFEDMFLYDGELQLKIRFNPKVSSFKVTRQEQKIDTIGSKFPFMFRNGIVEYKEFPIGGLISYYADNNKEFFKDEDDLNIIRGNDVHRTIALVDDGNGNYINQSVTPVDQNRNDTTSGKSWEISQTLDSVGYNMRAERRFKLKLLEWLGDGKIKLFRSPAEGNYLIRLMNISLTPEDKLGRMIHSFQATAYEVEELTYKNLLDLGFIGVKENEADKIRTESIYVKNILKDNVNIINSGIKLNKAAIVNLLSLANAENTESTSFYIQVGDSSDNTALVRTGMFTIELNGILPNVWIKASDNTRLSTNLNIAVNEVPNRSNLNLLSENYGLSQDFIDGLDNPTNISKNQIICAAMVDLVGDAIFTYQYTTTEINYGDISNISDMYISNVITSLIGPKRLNITSTTSTKKTEILKFYVLNFSKKKTTPLYDVTVDGETRYFLDSNHTNEVIAFERNRLYKLADKYMRYYSTNGTSLNESFSTQTSSTYNKIIFTIINSQGNEEQITYTDIPLIELKNNNFKSIYIGEQYQLDYACQTKITTFNNS